MACCYKVSFNGTLLYVGSTGNFKERVWKHKSDLENGKDMPFYNYLRENDIDFIALVFEKIETECETTEELRRIEGILIRELKPVCNKLIAGRTNKEWCEENKERRTEYMKEYHDKHKDQISEYQKEHYEKNKEEINRKKREYRAKNKDEINRRRRERNRLKKQQNN